MIVAKWFTNLGNQCSLPAVQGDRPGNDPSRIDTFERTKCCLTQLSCQYCDPNILGLLALCWLFALICHAGCVVWGFHNSTTPPWCSGNQATGSAQKRTPCTSVHQWRHASTCATLMGWNPIGFVQTGIPAFTPLGSANSDVTRLEQFSICIFVRIRASFYTS